MDTKYITGIAAIVVIALGAYMFLSKPAVPSQPAPTSADMGTATTTANASSTDSGGTGVSVGVGVNVGSAVTVTYTDAGFSPASVTVKKGQSVTFINKSSNDMWIASNPHPLHNGYDGTTEQQHCAPGYTGAAPLDECSPAATFTFTFDKVGTWGYHNHEGAQDHGTVIVTQ